MEHLAWPVSPHALLQLAVAVVLGSLIGWQREWAGKPAGLRTHILVALATAMVVMACTLSGMSQEGLSRVIQGIVTGIGFIGAGSILKLGSQRRIKGLTTAAGLWMTAVVGIAVGLDQLALAVVTALGTSLVLALAGPLERAHLEKRHARPPPDAD